MSAYRSSLFRSFEERGVQKSVHRDDCLVDAERSTATSSFSIRDNVHAQSMRQTGSHTAASCDDLQL